MSGEQQLTLAGLMLAMVALLMVLICASALAAVLGSVAVRLALRRSGAWWPRCLGGAAVAVGGTVLVVNFVLLSSCERGLYKTLLEAAQWVAAAGLALGAIGVGLTFLRTSRA